MDFFKQAQEFAASANVGGDDSNNKAGGGAGGLGSLMSEAQGMLKTQSQQGDGAPAQTHGELPGGRQVPTNAELMESSKLLFGAAQGQKVGNQQLAGAAEDLLGGLAAHGKLDQGQYSTYINQAEQYLHKYSGQDDAADKSSAPPAAHGKPAAMAQDETPAPAAAAAPAEQEPEAAAPARAPAPAQEAGDEGAGNSLTGKMPSWMNDRA